jgi:type III polyketide synthase
MVMSNGFGDLNLSIIGLGTQYPPYAIKPEALDTLSKQFYPDSPS